MGYCMELIEHNFRIEKENIDRAFNSLKEYIRTHERPMWVTPSVVINTEDFYEAFEEIRYPLTTDDSGDYILDYFCGEKLGNDKDILNSIAKYVVPKSYIEFEGEDGDVLRLVFNGKTCEEEWRAGDID